MQRLLDKPLGHSKQAKSCLRVNLQTFVFSSDVCVSLYSPNPIWCEHFINTNRTSLVRSTVFFKMMPKFFIMLPKFFIMLPKFFIIMTKSLHRQRPRFPHHQMSSKTTQRTSTRVGTNLRPYAPPRKQQEGLMPIVSMMTEAVWERQSETVDRAQQRRIVRCERQKRHLLILQTTETRHAPGTVKSPDMLTKRLPWRFEAKKRLDWFHAFTLGQTGNDIADDEYEGPFRLLGELLIVVHPFPFPSESNGTAVAHHFRD